MHYSIELRSILITTITAAGLQGLVRQTTRSGPNPNEIIGSEEKNSYLSAWRESSIRRALPLKGSTSHKEWTKEELTHIQRSRHCYNY